MEINKIDFMPLNHKEYLALINYMSNAGQVIVGEYKKDILKIKEIKNVEGNPPLYKGVQLDIAIPNASATKYRNYEEKDNEGNAKIKEVIKGLVKLLY